MRRFLITVMLFSTTLFLTSCAAGGGGSSSESSGITYKDMKSMVIDILKTEDAQKALQESFSSQSGFSAQSSSSMSAQDVESVRMAVKDVILSPDYDEVLKSLMTDTRFAGEFSKAVNEQNKDLHVELIKDPQYQEGLASAFESEDMQKVILKVVKGAEYRKELMSLMQESMKNPIFKMQMLDLMKQAVTEELSVKAESGGEGQDGEGQGQKKDSGQDKSSSSEGDSKKKSEDEQS